MWHARCAVLSLLGIYLHASPDVQRLAVQKWNVVPVLISLLWEQPIQKLALDMVGPSDALLHNSMCMMLTFGFHYSSKGHAQMEQAHQL